MKKSLVVIVVAMLIAVMFIGGCSVKEFNVEKSEGLDVREQAYSYMETLAYDYPDRTSGSKENNDLKAAAYLAKELKSFGYKPEGVFDFEGVEYDGINRFSIYPGYNDQQARYGYNVVFYKSASVESKGTILLSTQYDNLYNAEPNNMNADGSYESGASTAALLTLASALKDKELPYDLKIVFYGGGSYNWSGASFYLGSMTQTEIDRILVSIDFGQIVGGDYNYAYTLDKKTDYGNYVEATINANELDFAKIPQDKRVGNGKLVNEGLYNYFHIGMLSNNIFMMNRQVPTITFLSHNWKDKSFPTRTEIKGLENIYQTPADTMKNMIDRVGEDKIKDNLNTFVNLAYDLINPTDVEDFIVALSTAREQMPSSMAQSDTTGMILSICLTILSVIAVILVMVRMRKIVAEKHDVYTQMLHTQNSTPTQNEKPIDVFGWDSDKKDAPNNIEVTGEEVKKEDKDNNDDIFKDL